MGERSWDRGRVYRWQKTSERELTDAGAPQLARQVGSASGIFAPDAYKLADTHVAIAAECKTVLEGALKDLLSDPGAVIAAPATDATLSPTVTREGAFFAGQQYDAMRLAHDILTSARTSLDIIENYPGAPLLDQLSAKTQDVRVRLMGNISDRDRAFTPLAEAFAAQHGGLEVRRSSAWHDRFVIVDRTVIYHFGASLKDLGKKGFMFSRIEEPAVATAIKARFDEEWTKATPF